MGAGSPERATAGGALRRYPPLVILGVTVLALGMILPSALRVPPQDPSPVLEFAPVPPSDETPPDQSGNLSSLTLGSSSTVTETVEGAADTPDGGGDTLRTKECVFDTRTNTNRQTWDPMSPPCAAHFDGVNGGETWQGVSGDEIRVLIYLDVGCPNHECSPDEKTYHDLNDLPKPPCPKTWPGSNPNNDQCDYIWIRVARGLANHFNERFQTYDRRVHYYAYVTSASSPETRRADAVDNYDTIRPFAVIDYATYNGYNEAYDQAMAARGVLVFSSRSALPNSFFTEHAGYSWGFWPDVERWSKLYSTYICDNVSKHRVSHSGNVDGTGSMNGERRRFGLWYTSDQGEQGLRRFAALVKQQLRGCGVSWAAEEAFPYSGFSINAKDDGLAAENAVGRFLDDGVTTVLYLGGTETWFSKHAKQRGYYPEIVLAGDLENDNNYAGRSQEQSVWRNAWAVHSQLRIDRQEEAAGARAYREGYPTAPQEDGRFANEMYRDHFMLFQAIQVAGPELNPQNIDRGFHAIPEHESTDPYVASCFFEPDDYTCVKDATIVWWDEKGISPGDGQAGCWRMVDGGRRALAGSWWTEDKAFSDPKAPCTGFDSRIQIDPRT